VQSKLDVFSAPPVTAAEAAVQEEHRLNLARSCKTDRENGYEDHRFLATSDTLSSNQKLVKLSSHSSDTVTCKYFVKTLLYCSHLCGNFYTKWLCPRKFSWTEPTKFGYVPEK